jgi:hypothetical protein
MPHTLRRLLRLAGLFVPAPLVLLAATASTPPGGRGGPLPADFFEKRVRPLLTARCLGCHGESRRQAGLDLRSRAGMLKGGDSGPALVPGSAEKSLLYRKLASREMPPRKTGKLADDEVAVVRAWIDAGAPAPGDRSDPTKAAVFWSLRKPARPKVPELTPAGGLTHPIDRFVEAKRREKGLRVAPQAGPAALVRRAYFDLVGLPPPPEKVEAFVKDPSAEAFARLVDELLASPAYGERYARHWLDVARYADSGGFETDIYYKNAWRWRDWVVGSFNADKPYDRFVMEQVAGDERWPDELSLEGSYEMPKRRREALEARTGTGLYGLGPQVHESNMDGKKILYEQLADWVDTTGAVFLGLTVGCARCHDHKFDPITQKEYFSLQAVFASARLVEEPIVNPMELADQKQHYPRLVAVDEARRAYRLFEKRTAGRPLRAAEQAERQRLRDRIAGAVLDVPENASSTPGSRWDTLLEVPTVTVLAPRSAALVPAIRVLNRGDLDRPRQRVAPDLPGALRRATGYDEPLPGPFGSRSALARWLVRPDHPLTARVMVNRVWGWHFGRGLVATPGDFGKMGVPPSHPELLDWLACEFVSKGWRLKELHRLIMTSRTYRLASAFDDPDNRRIDPDNRYLWRGNRRRLEGEAIWDALHAAGGNLNPARGGRPVVPPLVEEELASLRDRWHWPASADPADHTRRGLYVLARRNFRFPLFEAFDAPVNAVSCPRRETTTVAPQALWLLNNSVVRRQARAFAARIVREAGDKPEAWVERAWRLALGRPPSKRERGQALGLLAELERGGVRLAGGPAELAKLPPPRAAALVQLCLAVFNLNEFVHVD